MDVATWLALAIVVAPGELPDKLAESIEESRLVEAVEALQSFGSRVAGTEGGRRADAWIAAQLDAMGVAFERQVFDLVQVFEPARRVGAENLIARFGGEGPRLVLVAHTDSKCYDAATATTAGWRWDRDPAPGADDNASGVAALLELARALRAAPPRRPVDLVFAGGEELAIVQPGAWMVNIGAEHLAERYVVTKTPILGAIAVDMLLRARPFGGALRVYSDGRLGSSALAEALALASAAYAPELELRVFVDPSFAWSDHGAFWERGWPGILFIEDDFHHARYHRPDDRLGADGFYSSRQMFAATRALAAAVGVLTR